ncbi:MAG: right-handed parallel beta-helix repeat-containing protein [Cryomorphaceae bacterium]|nr:right-handed parallel beta-helix repeat-containing protein [Cryomorphaceae bacterium]
MVELHIKTENSFGGIKGWMLWVSVMFTIATPILNAQCIATTQNGMATLGDTNLSPVTISACNLASEFALLSISDSGQYSFSSSVGADYLTVTDDLNSVIGHGQTPLTVAMPSSGAYRLHIAANASCDSAGSCRVTSGVYADSLTQGSFFLQVGFGTTVSNNTLYVPAYRFSATSFARYNRSITLYQEAELLAAGILPGYFILGMSFQKDIGGTTPGNDLEMKIWLRNSSRTNISSAPWDTLNAGSTQVLDAKNIVFTDSTGWVEFKFDTSFYYTGGALEVSFENQLNGNSPFGTDSWKWIYDSSMGVGLGSLSSLSSFSTTTPNLSTSFPHSHRPNTRFEVLPSTYTNLALQDFVEPVISCPGSTDVVVVIGNTGIADIDTATIGWALNGVVQPSFGWSGNLSANDTTHLHIGSFTSTVGANYNIEAYIQNVGPGLDTITSNDSISMLYQSALEGNFTINPHVPATGFNFHNFSDAVQTLNTLGICGPVLFEVSADTFNEQIILGDVQGTSTLNTITFRGAGAENTVLKFAQNVSNDRYTWRLNGSSHVIIDSMSVVADENGTYGWAIHITNGAHDLTITNCSIVAFTLNTSVISTNFQGVIASGINTSFSSGSAGFSNFVFDNNIFIGGHNSVRMNGITADRASNIQFTNNRFEDFINSGFHIFVGENIIIDRNYFQGRQGITVGVGVNIINVNGFEITNNESALKSPFLPKYSLSVDF